MGPSNLFEGIGFILFAYLFGGIPWAYIVVKLTKNVDIRKVGSGNVGATNAFRVGGPLVGALVAILDILKGSIPTFLTMKILGPNWAILAALSAMLGHSYTPFLGFSGGKGVATSVGAFAVIIPKAVGMGALLWILLLFLFRWVSLASILAVLGAGLYVLLSSHTPFVKVVISMVVFVILIRHKSNISRLLRGKEPKVERGKKA